MRTFVLFCLALSVCVTAAHAQIEPESWQPVETMDDPGENWFISYENGYARIFDAATGEMHGLVNTSLYTPTIQPSFKRKEFYSTNIFYSRVTYGERTDRFIIHDFENLSPVAEIEIPQKSSINPYRTYMGMLSAGDHVVSMNMTPSQSVTVVDVDKRKFVGEISIAGCALILPVEDNAFLTICGDGTVMLIGINEDGEEAYRVRSDEFFDVEDDPVYDQPEETAEGWMLTTFGGVSYEVIVNGQAIEISDPWQMITDAEREDPEWWPGGGQLIAIHKELGLLYMIVHVDGDDSTQYDSGRFIWLYDIKTRKKLSEHEFAFEIENIMVTQEKEPLLLVDDDDDNTLVYDAKTMVLQRTIPESVGANFLDF